MAKKKSLARISKKTGAKDQAVTQIVMKNELCPGKNSPLIFLLRNAIDFHESFENKSYSGCKERL